MDEKRSENPEFVAAYRDHKNAQWLRFSVYSAWLAITLVPGFAILDYLIYPGHMVDFLTLRISCTTIVGMFAVISVRYLESYAKQLTIAGYCLIQLMIAYMIYVTNGPSSSYYAGLNIALIGMGFFLPTVLLETLLFSLVTLALYGVSVTYSHSFEIGPSFYAKVFFLLSTGVIATASSFFLERRRYNEYLLSFQLEQRNEELDELNRQKSHFFSNVSHELRTPLTLILAPLQEMLGTGRHLPDSIASRLGVVRDNALRLLKLVNDLLDVITMEEGKDKLESVPVELNSVLRALLNSMDHLAHAKSVSLTGRPNDTPLAVEGDPRALEKIFVNLLSNAIKFTEKGGGIHVESGIDHSNVLVRVRDTGIGIERDEQAHIFDRFHQVDASSTRRYRGTGLGLALVKELTERMGGSVEVDSAPGKGTCMSVRLPLATFTTGELLASGEAELDEIEAMHRQAEQKGGLAVEDPGLENELDIAGDDRPKLLIVEDEPDMRRYLVDLLEEEYHVLQARTGTEGLRTTLEKEPDLVLLDLMLPEMDGLEVCRRIRASGTVPGPKIMLLTARVDDESKITALRHGADDFLTKPFSSVEVKTRLKNHVISSSLEHRLAERNKKLEATLKELKQTEVQLIHSEKLNALGTLSAGLLHEINNPLNYSLTALQLIRCDKRVKESELLQEVIGDIDEGMQRIRSIVTDLRAFAYPSEAEVTQPFEFNEVVESALRFSAHQLDGANVTLSLPSRRTVLGSKSHIAQVLVNLLTNAAKATSDATHEQDAEICVRGENREGRLVVTVADNGVGMDNETIERIFDPFFTTRDVGAGMGLGLSICHTIIANHGGHIQAHSSPGDGTEIVFDLPLVGDA